MKTDAPTGTAKRRFVWGELRAGVGITVVAVLVGLLVLEGLTRVVVDRRGMHFGLEMWKYAKHVKRRSSLTAMSHEHAPNREAVLMGVPVRTNSLGLRDREFSLNKAPDVRRILVLGDSMTFGWGTREEDTYPKVLERLLNRGASRYEVINAGVGNYNSAQEVAYFRERGILLQPDEVILGFYINDAEPTPSPNQSLIVRHSYAYVVGSALGDAIARQVGWKPPLTTYYAQLYDDRSPGWQACRNALVELSALCHRMNVKLWIVLIPELHGPVENYPFRRAHSLVAEIARRENAAVLDLLPDFTGIDLRSLWVSAGDAHANARGHEIIAHSIYLAMSSQDQRTARRAGR